MGASAALAGLSGCRWPHETIVPFAGNPPGRTPGVPVQYATAIERHGQVQGLLVTSMDGRPIKVEGNALHPANQGGADLFAQALILGLYDPDRGRRPSEREGDAIPETPAQVAALPARDWADFARALRARFANVGAESRGSAAADSQAAGSRLAILARPATSPTRARLAREVLRWYPGARWYEYDPISDDARRAGLRRALGPGVALRPRYDRARIIVSFDEDFLGTEAGAAAWTRDFTAARRAGRERGTAAPGGGSGPAEGDRATPRLWVFESLLTLTGARADRRLALRPSEVAVAAGKLARALVEGGLTLPGFDEAARAVFTQHPLKAPAVDVLAQELLAHRGRCLLVAGRRQPATVHSLIAALNVALGNVGATVEPVAAPVRKGDFAELAALIEDLKKGDIDSVVILDGNPVYDAPADLSLAAALAKAAFTVHLAPAFNETSACCRWYLPAAHELESWGDAQSDDGTVSVRQPLIEPLYDGWTEIDLLVLLWVLVVPGIVSYRTDPPSRAHLLSRLHRLVRSPSAADPLTTLTPTLRSAARDEIRHTMIEQFGVADEADWRRLLHDGVRAAPGRARPPLPLGEVLVPTGGGEGSPKLIPGWAEGLTVVAQSGREPGLELVLYEDATVSDGRFANNAWLQELPDPVTKLTWDNALLLSPATARAQQLEHEQRVTAAFAGRELETAVFTLPGLPAGVAALSLGWGRSAPAGAVGAGRGFNAYRLRTRAHPWGGPGVTLKPGNGRYPLAASQDHHAVATVAGREEQRRIPDLVREASAADFARRGAAAFAGAHHGPPPAPLWEEHRYEDGHSWGMTIDLDVCTGCSACVVACQAENNVPVVGKSELARGREMHWLRIDRYFVTADDEAAAMRVQPMTCHQCENAPCEQVCPVAATTHSDEGLNDMTYNRCIGTRYCSNNCPFKVRRFNYFWNHHGPAHPRGTRELEPVEALAFNPEVTVRARGVMEKCTFCVQRIQQAKIAAKNEGRRRVADGAIVPACAQTCPAQAITFGDLNDPASRVRAHFADPRAYGLLDELHLKPRLKYLGRVNEA